MKAKGDACIFVGYATQSKRYKVYNKRTRLIVETIHVNFNELPHMASDHNSSGLAPQCQANVSEDNTLGPELQCQENVPIADKTVTTSLKELEILFGSMFDEYFNGATQSDIQTTLKHKTQEQTVNADGNINQAVNAQLAKTNLINSFGTSVHEVRESSSHYVDPSNMHTFYQRHPSEYHWTRDHPFEQVLGNPS
nr:integrase, catalytic region, zinc finger, CCHC-type, peptidase aspartic, catalytic [Tanacetum cinerariifolium]